MPIIKCRANFKQLAKVSTVHHALQPQKIEGLEA